ncbi:hypothetical protein ACR6C2_44205 [Streptomyces sp. INA 01156]
MSESFLGAASLDDALGAGLAATVRRTGASVGALYLLDTADGYCAWDG